MLDAIVPKNGTPLPRTTGITASAQLVDQAQVEELGDQLSAAEDADVLGGIDLGSHGVHQLRQVAGVRVHVPARGEGGVMGDDVGRYPLPPERPISRYVLAPIT